MDRSKLGISLIELLVAVTLVSLVVISAAVVYTGAVNFLNSFGAQSEMQNQANIALQNIVGDVYLCERIVITSSSDITVWFDEDLNDMVRYWRDEDLFKRKYTGLGEEVVANGVNTISFSLSAMDTDTKRQTLQIVLAMLPVQGISGLRLKTKVAIRRYE